MKFCRSLFLILALLLVLASAGLAQADKLTYLAGRLDEAELAELQELAPNVVFLSGLSDEQVLSRAAEIDGADAHVLTADFLAAATNLRWVQSWSAGVDRYLEIEGLRDNEQIVLTNMQGVHGPAIAEHVMGSLLALTRKLPQLHAAQREGRWDRQASAGATTLSGRTMFVVGMGGIGSQVARRAHAFDMKVLATVRNPDKKEKPAYVDRMGGAADLDEFLAESEVVVVALPLTDETRGLFDAAAFARLPQIAGGERDQWIIRGIRQRHDDNGRFGEGRCRGEKQCRDECRPNEGGCPSQGEEWGLVAGALSIHYISFANNCLDVMPS